MRIRYPVATDNNYAVWNAFDNHYWPALYLADAQGQIRHHHFGEGEYQQSEMIIQQLLAEPDASTSHGLVALDARGAEAPADWATLKSAENYTGYERAENFDVPGRHLCQAGATPYDPARLGSTTGPCPGDWTMQEQATTPTQAGGQIVNRFHARDLHLVMGPAQPGPAVRFRVPPRRAATRRGARRRH